MVVKYAVILLKAKVFAFDGVNESVSPFTVFPFVGQGGVGSSRFSRPSGAHVADCAGDGDRRVAAWGLLA